MDFLNQYQPQFDSALEHLRKELASLRTSRASPALVENVMIEAYGVKTPLVQLASLSAPEPQTILVEPWDKNITGEIERGIERAGLGLTLTGEGHFLRLKMSSLSEERRQSLVRELHERLEQVRIGLRGLRDEIREKIKEMEKNKEISQDDKYNLFEKLNEKTREYTEKVDEMGERKEREILEE